MSQLPTYKEVLEIEGPMIIGIAPAAKHLKTSPSYLKKLIEQKGLFKDCYLVKDKDFTSAPKKDNDAKYYFILRKLEEFSASNTLPEPKLLEQQYGTLITRFEAAKILKISFKTMEKRIQQGEYRECYFKAGEEIHSAIQEYYFIKRKVEELAMIHLPSVEELEQKYGKLVHIFEAAKVLNVRKGTLQKMIDHGYFKDVYFTSGIDVQTPPRRTKYLFILEKLKRIDLKEHFLGTEEVADHLKIGVNQLRNWYKKGLLKEGRISEQYWKIDWLEKNVNRIMKEVKTKSFQDQRNTVTGTPLEWLEEEAERGANVILNWINEYADYICNGGTIEMPGSIIGGKKPKNKERKKYLIRRSLAILCYKIVCGRCSIDDYWEITRPGFYRPLTEEERQIFDPTVFTVVDFRESDMSYAMRGYIESNFYVLVETYLKPFMWFVFKKQKQNLRESKRSLLEKNQKKSSPEWEAYETKKDLLELFEEDLEDIFKASFQEKPEPLEENQRPAIHFTREQIILFDQNIKNYKYITRHGHVRHKFENPLKRKAMYLFGSFTGVRNEELCELLIRDFELTEAGFLRRFEYVAGETFKTPQLGIVGPSKVTDDPNGYGLLKIRKDVTKGAYGPSPVWGTYIAPSLVTVINEYLSVLYKKFPETRAKGYLFRSEDRLHDEIYAPTTISYWIWENREVLCNFLPESEKRKYKYYDVRHTVADLILNQTKVTDDLRPHLERAAELHIRHDINNKSIRKSILRKNYAKDGTKADEYFSIMIEALGFPINLVGERQDSEYKSFYDWEIRKGYRKVVVVPEIEPEIISTETNRAAVESVSEEEAKRFNVLKENLRDQKNFFNEISSGFKKSFTKKYGLTEDGWLELLPKLQQKIVALEAQINEMKVG
ncbi:hypothetical protein WMW72_20380 [Paenibacillus filicis]|uniref:Helix-turn-helix domain-containing protein n=1 Tax=Paenibacillus filicis TaxID=669464 RepID=A0ABU9DN22_9BACL